MDDAASNDDLELLKHLHKKDDCTCTTMAMDWANDINVLQWLHDNRKEGCTTWAMYQAAMFNNIKKIKWLHKHNKPWNEWALRCAAEYGYFDIVKWFINNKKSTLLLKCGPGGIRTPEGMKPTDLQSVPFNHFGTDPFLLITTRYYSTNHYLDNV